MADQSLFEKLLSSGLTSEQASQIVDAETAASVASDADETNRALAEMNRVAKTQGNVKLGDKLTAEQLEKLQSNTAESRKLRGSFKTADTYPAGNLLEGRIRQPIHERPHITKIIQNPDAVFSKLENTINPDAVRRSVQLAELAGTAGRTLAKGVRLTPGVAASEALLNPTQIDETESDIQKNREQLALEKGGEAAKTIIKNLHPDNQIFRSNVPNTTGLLAGLAEQAEATSPGSGEGWRRISTGETELPTPTNLANFKEEKSPMGMAESLKARSEIEDTSVPTYFPEDEGGESTSRQLAKQSATSLPGTTKDKLDVTKALEGTAKEKRSVMDAYQEALARRGGMQLVSDIGKASAQIGAGLAGGVGPGLSIAAPKMDTSIYDSISKRAEDSIKDFAIEKQLKDEEALKDPNSPYSKLMRQVIEKLNPELKGKLDGLSGHEADKILASLAKIKASEDSLETRKIAQEANAIQRGILNEDRKRRIDNAENQRILAQTDKYITEANPKNAKSGPIFVNEKIIEAGDRTRGLVYDEYGRIKDLTPQEIEENALVFTNVITASTSGRSRAQVEAVVPRSARGDVSKILQWLKNDPTGTGQQEFTRRMMQTVDRESEIAASKIQKHLDTLYAIKNRTARDPVAYKNAIDTLKAGYDKYLKKPQPGGSSPSSEPPKSGITVPLPKNHGMVPGKIYNDKQTGKKMVLSDDGTHMVEYK